MDGLIYLDNNSTTKTDERVLDAMIPFLRDWYGNASSSHYFGLNVKKKIDAARNEIANFVSAIDEEIIFTSGATEAVNIAIKGLAFSNLNNRRRLVTTATEHKAVLDTYKYLETRGFEISYLPVSSDGLIDFELFKATVDNETLLVSVMIVNNETGVIHNISDLVSYAKQWGVYFLCDATQAAGKLDINVENLGVDFLCFSGHKFYGPKGIGVLYISDRSKLRNKLQAQQHGGGHEFGLRSGTVNTPGIIGLAKACEIATSEMKQNAEYVGMLRDKLEMELLTSTDAFVNGNIIKRIYNTSNISFPGHDANVLIGRMKNFALSNGSACTSSVIEPSYVLRAMGVSESNAFSAIRFSLGKYNTLIDVEMTIKEMKKILEQTE